MNHFRKLLRNAQTIVSNPAMAVSYARWTLGRACGEVVAPSHFGARIGGFENFSNYWGTLCKIPSPEQFDFLAAYLSGKDAVCIDVGANIGSFSIIMGKRVPGCVIHAFEPALSTAGILQANIERNRLTNVKAHPMAVCDKLTSVRFSNEPDISQRNHIITADEQHVASCEVPATSLDAFCAAHRIQRIGFVKVDCEGVEPLVLRGARGLLNERRISAILVEVCPRNLKAFKFSIADLMAAVSSQPYRFHRIDENGVVGQPVSATMMAEIVSEDLLLLPC